MALDFDWLKCFGQICHSFSVLKLSSYKEGSGQRLPGCFVMSRVCPTRLADVVRERNHNKENMACGP
jgi:hypothetical protein